MATENWETFLYFCYLFIFLLSSFEPEVHNSKVSLCNGMLVIIKKHGHPIYGVVGSELARSVMIIRPNLIGCYLAKRLFSSQIIL